MSVISKQMFDDAVKGVDCAQMIHPWTPSCYKSSFQHIFFGIKGTGKFYLIIYMLQLLLKGNKIKLDDIKRQTLQLLQSTFFGSAFVTIFVVTNCLFRNTMGRFNYYIFPGLTSALGAFSIFLENPKKRGVTVTSFLYLMFEVFVRYLEEFNYIERTTGSETIVFMIFSASLLYLLRIVKRQKSNLWFFLPPAFTKSKNNNDNLHYCPHRGSCWDDIIRNTAKYFAFGVLVQWLRSTVPKFSRIIGEPSLLNPFNLKNLKLGSFTGLYVMTYKLTSCLLCRYRKEDSPLHAIPSGLLAGLAYIIRPDLTVILIALCNLLMLSEYHSKDKGLLPKWPFSEVAYIIASGILFHSQMAIPSCTPKQFVNLMHSFSNGKSTDINKRLCDLVAKRQELKKFVPL